MPVFPLSNVETPELGRDSMAWSQLEPLPVWFDNVFPQSGHCGTIGPEQKYRGGRGDDWTQLQLRCHWQSWTTQPTHNQKWKKNALGNSVRELGHEQHLNLMWQAFLDVAACTTITRFKNSHVFFISELCVWVGYVLIKRPKLWPGEICNLSFKAKHLCSLIKFRVLSETYAAYPLNITENTAQSKQMMKDAIQETVKLLYHYWLLATIHIQGVCWLRSLQKLAPVSQTSLLKPPSPLITHSISTNTSAPMCPFRLQKGWGP